MSKFVLQAKKFLKDEEVTSIALIAGLLNRAKLLLANRSFLSKKQTEARVERHR